MNHNKIILKRAKQIITAYLILFAFCADRNCDMSGYAPAGSSVALVNVLLNLMSYFRLAAGNIALTSAFLYITILCFLFYADKNCRQGNHRAESICGICFSVFMVFGESYHLRQNWSLVFANGYAALISALMIAGYAVFFKRCLILLFQVWDNIQNDEYAFGMQQIDEPLRKGGRIFFMLALLCCWLPYIIIRFPGALSHDARMQIGYYIGYFPFTSHHPPFHTYVLGGCYSLGKALGMPNLGLFVYTLLQAGLCAYALSGVLQWMQSRIKDRRVLLGILLFYGLCPFIPIYVTTIVKDVPYIACFILLVLQTAKIVYEPFTAKRAVEYAVYALFAMLLRKEAVYIVICMTIILVLGLLFKKDMARRNAFYLAVAAGVSVVIVILCNAVLYPALGIEKGSRREGLSMLLQQTARYARDYGDEVTFKEYEALNAVLEYGTLATEYEGWRTDPVKDNFREEADGEQLRTYLGVWFGQFMKHPDCYIEAFCNLNYPLIYPEYRFGRYQDLAVVDETIWGFSFEPFSVTKLVDDLWNDILSVLEKIPIYSLLENVAAHMWLLIICIAWNIKKKKYQNLFVFVPCILVVGVCCLSPSIVENPRYIYPVIWLTPLLLGLTVYSKKGKENGTELIF